VPLKAKLYLLQYKILITKPPTLWDGPLDEQITKRLQVLGAVKVVANLHSGSMSDPVELLRRGQNVRRLIGTLVRVHEPFVSLDMFDFDASRHAFSVQDAMRMIAHHKEGVIVLLRRNEPASEILERLGQSPRGRQAARKWDPRLHGIGAQILRDLGVGKMRVLARPKRIPSMEGFGLEVVEYVSPDDAIAVKAAG